MKRTYKLTFTSMQVGLIRALIDYALPSLGTVGRRNLRRLKLTIDENVKKRKVTSRSGRASRRPDPGS